MCTYMQFSCQACIGTYVHVTGTLCMAGQSNTQERLARQDGRAGSACRSYAPVHQECLSARQCLKYTAQPGILPGTCSMAYQDRITPGPSDVQPTHPYRERVPVEHRFKHYMHIVHHNHRDASMQHSILHPGGPPVSRSCQTELGACEVLRIVANDIVTTANVNAELGSPVLLMP